MTDGATLEGWMPEIGPALSLAEVVEKAFDYRGNVTVIRTDGSETQGYLFNRNADGPVPFVQLFDLNGGGPHTIFYREIRRERAADSGRDHERNRFDSGGPRFEMRGARARADEIERSSTVVWPVVAGDTGETQVTGQTARLEVDGGDDENAGHTPLGGVEPEPFSGRSAALAASFARSHAA